MSSEKIWAAIERLDVVRGPRIVATLGRLLEEWPEAQKLFEPRIDLVIAAIREQQRTERRKWREGA